MSNGAPTAATALYALLGDPVSHSLSPAFQNAAMRTAGIDAVYVALRCAPSGVDGLMRGIAAAGGGGNVTVPHKEMAADALDRRTAAGDRTGACNTFWMEDGVLCGDNTDVAGAREAILALTHRSGVEARRVLVLGAGGAASAVLAALRELQVAEIALVCRTPQRGRLLAERHADAGAPIAVHENEADAGPHWDLLVNATPVGMSTGEMPAVGDVRFSAALDLVYAPGGTAWVRALRAAGLPAEDGQEMLLQQGAAAFRCWFRQEPDLQVMRAVLGAATASETRQPLPQ